MRNRGLFIVAGCLCCVLWCRTSMFSQGSGGETAGETTIGPAAVRQSTAEIMASPATPSGGTGAIRLSLEFDVDREHLPQNPASPAAAVWPPLTSPLKPPAGGSLYSPQLVALSFLGTQVSETYSVPPDAMGAIGPTQYIVAVNGRIRTFAKSTGTADGVLDKDMDTFFQSVMTPPVSSNYTSDPRIRYDRLSKKWFVIMLDIPGGKATQANRIMIAVSDSGTITSSSVWSFFYISASTTDFADYPTLGIDRNALYIGCNLFKLSGGNYDGTNGYVVQKSSILGSGPIVSTRFTALTTAGGSGPYTPQGADNFDTTASYGYFIGCDNSSYGLLQIRRITNPGSGSPTISANIPLTVPNTYTPLNVPHLGNTYGTKGELDAIDDRCFMAVIRNGSLWTVQNLAVSNTGVAGASGTRDGIRWYQIQNIDATPSLAQSGTVYDPSLPNDGTKRSYWMPSIMISGQGHAAMAFTTAGASEYANAGTNGRLSGDAAGTMQSAYLYTSSTTAYNPTFDTGTSGARRWGDYSYVSVDPDDDMTMWTIAEFCNSTNSYGVQIAKLLAPGPAAPAAAVPQTVTVGSDTSIVVTGTTSGGTGFFEPGAAFPHHLTAVVNGGGVTVNSITYSGPSSVTLHVSIAANAAGGGRTITITNPDGQSATSSGPLITINANCSPISLSPGVLPAGYVSATYRQQVSASGGTSPYHYAVTSGSLPPGIALSGSGLISGKSSSIGMFGFTVTATDSLGCTGNSSFSLQLLACPGISVQPLQLPTAVSNASYSQLLTASGGTPPYTFTVSGGTLPSGLALSSSGLISGRPGSHGASIFTVAVSDSDSCSAAVPETLMVVCPVLTIAPTVLSGASAGLPYHVLFTGSGGKSPYLFSRSAGQLPPGLALSAGGSVDGTVTGQGTFVFDITMTDSLGCTAVLHDSISSACQVLSVVPALLPKGNIHITYAESLHLPGGFPPVAWNLVSGVVPAGMTLTPQGVLTGIPQTGDSSVITVSATDSIGCTAQAALTLWIDTLSLAEASVAVLNGWNLVSDPFAGPHDSITDIYPAAISDAFSYGGGAYHVTDILAPLSGYWLRFDSSEAVHLIGPPIQNDSIAVADGWNLIGSFSSTVPFGALQGVGTSIGSLLYEYRNGYQPVDTIAPGGGYWIKCNGPGVLAPPAGSGVPGKARIPFSATRSIPGHELIIHDAAGGSATLTAAVYRFSPAERALLSLPPLPPGGGFDVRFSTGSQTADIDSGAATVVQAVFLQSEHYPLTLVARTAPGTSRLSLRIAGADERRMRTPLDSLTIGDPSVRSVSLIIRKQASAPAAYRLYDNYPNPFNPSTTVGFDLPVRSQIRLGVYNTLGQFVAELANDERSAGYYQVVWNGKLGNGAEAGSGIYFVRLDAVSADGPGDHFSGVRKIVLLR